ncbi:MAG: tRNA 2-selenouridine(34) synthase MnmH [Pseudomonadales bacterium]|nr:tRNA 2-selenouridine(34) synthase MnmH [Pseudomonadales bacterium]
MTSSKPSKQSPKPHPSPLRSLLATNTPILDVRAEAEFEQGAIPNSINLPILNDAERTRVGITYKQQGQLAAEKVGHRLVSGEIRGGRVDGWKAFCAQDPTTVITCWRGGRRSQLAQEWLRDAGLDVERVAGGYKSLRQTCLDILANDTLSKRWLVLAGKTGTAKTVRINQVQSSIDLEGLANHRGSAFGNQSTPQPSPATFENQLACAFLKLDSPCLIVEDESRTIGRLAIPESWHEQMQAAPLVLIDESDEFRITHIEREYVAEPLASGVSSESLRRQYQSALDRIARRLGGKDHKQITILLTEAFLGQRGHRDWIEDLLRKYYDPMYEFQLKKKQPRVVMSGDHQAVLAYLSDHGHVGVRDHDHVDAQ